MNYGSTELLTKWRIIIQTVWEEGSHTAVHITLLDLAQSVTHNSILFNDLKMGNIGLWQMMCPTIEEKF